MQTVPTMLRRFPAGARLFSEGEAGDVVYVLRSGKVRVWRQIGAEQRTLALLGAGEIVGEWALVNGRPRSASCTTEEPTECIVLDGETLERMITTNGEIAVRLVKRLIARLAVLDAQNEILLHTDPRSRALLALVREAERSGEPVDGGIRVAAAIEEVAGQVGVEPRDAGELLATLRRTGLVTTTGTEILVRRLGELQEIGRRLNAGRRSGASVDLVIAAAAARPRAP